MLVDKRLVWGGYLSFDEENSSLTADPPQQEGANEKSLGESGPEA